VISYLSTLGIASLFLFAGLEVDLVELRRQLPSLAGHFAVRGLVLVACARIAAVYLHLGWQVDWLLALALLTPSTGFILDMLPHSGLDHVEQSEVALHAVAGEVTAVFLFLVISQADSVKTLLISGGAIALLIAFMPLVFLALGRFVVPYAPGSEFSLLLMVGLICAVITETLGVYYLVGAFVAGLVARSLSKRMTTLASEQNLEAIRLFASFLSPSTFFTMDSEYPAPRWSPTLCCTGLRLRRASSPCAWAWFGCNRASCSIGGTAAAYGFPSRLRPR
jgi:Kef-type K+ transport system membrane component KefB